MHQLASRMEPGLVTDASEGLLARITHLLGRADDDPQTLLARIQIMHSATRRRPSPWFPLIARATVRRQRLQMTYYTRSRDASGERLVSPQRLLHYRENWYLVAWCHQAGGLRLFALDAIQGASVDKAAARALLKQAGWVVRKGVLVHEGDESRNRLLRKMNVYEPIES